MDTLQNEIKVKNLIEFAYDEKIVLPEFQRPFVWEKDQILLLIDSLFHDYTISSILFWDGSDELARRRIGGNIRDIEYPEGKKKKITYLLDGQQRVTALLLSFTCKDIYKGNNTKKKETLEIFWNSEYKGDDPELRWLIDNEAEIKIKDKILYLSEMNQEEIFKKFKSKYVKIKHVFEWDNIQKHILKDMKGDAELFVQYNIKVSNLRENILDRKIIKIEQKGSLENVLEVFERINTKNTKLSIFDIMVAKTYRKIDKNYFDLRNYFILLNYEKGIKNDYFKNIGFIDLSGTELKIGGAEMLFIIMIMLRHKFKATQILKISTLDLLDNVKYLHDKFHYIIDIMNKFFYIEKSEVRNFQPIMKYLAAAITYFEKINLKEKDFLEKWFWNTILKNRYPGAQNERIAKDYQLTKDSKNLTKTLQVMVKDNTRDFSYILKSKNSNNEFIDAYYNNKNQQIYRAMILLLKNGNAKDFYSGIIAMKKASIKFSLEEHHIFPVNSEIGKKITKKYKDHKYNEIINNISNIALLTKETNNAIRKKNPSVYIREFIKEYKNKGKLENYNLIMKSQFITEKMIEYLLKDDFESFFRDRTILFVKRINKLCNI